LGEIQYRFRHDNSLQDIIQDTKTTNESRERYSTGSDMTALYRTEFKTPGQLTNLGRDTVQVQT
jgi:hypothetical protein